MDEQITLKQGIMTPSGSRWILYHWEIGPLHRVEMSCLGRGLSSLSAFLVFIWSSILRATSFKALGVTGSWTTQSGRTEKAVMSKFIKRTEDQKWNNNPVGPPVWPCWPALENLDGVPVLASLSVAPLIVIFIIITNRTSLAIGKIPSVPWRLCLF